MDFDAMLNTNATKATTKKKADSIPVFQLTEAEIHVFNDMILHKEQAKNHEGLFRQNERVILDKVQERFDTDALEGHFNHSYLVVAGKKSVKFITVDRFSIAQDDSVISRAKELLGDKFDEFIGTEMSVEMKPEVFSDETLKAELVEMVGDKFAKFFQTVKRHVVKKGANENLHKIAKTKQKLAEIREIIIPTKPSLK